MANKKISEATPKATLDNTDMIPLAASGSATAYHIKGEKIFDSIPAATTSAKGSVELATNAETQTGTDTERAVTPAGLAAAIGPKQMGAGFCYIGQVNLEPASLTAAAITTQFTTAAGRGPVEGDILVFADTYFTLYFGIYDAGAGAFSVFNLDSGAWSSIA